VGLGANKKKFRGPAPVEGGKGIQEAFSNGGPEGRGFFWWLCTVKGKKGGKKRRSSSTKMSSQTQTARKIGEPRGTSRL